MQQPSLSTASTPYPQLSLKVARYIVAHSRHSFDHLATKHACSFGASPGHSQSCTSPQTLHFSYHSSCDQAAATCSRHRKRRTRHAKQMIATQIHSARHSSHLYTVTKLEHHDHASATHSRHRKRRTMHAEQTVATRIHNAMPQQSRVRGNQDRAPRPHSRDAWLTPQLQNLACRANSCSATPRRNATAVTITQRPKFSTATVEQQYKADTMLRVR